MHDNIHLESAKSWDTKIYEHCELPWGSDCPHQPTLERCLSNATECGNDNTCFHLQINQELGLSLDCQNTTQVEDLKTRLEISKAIFDLQGTLHDILTNSTRGRRDARCGYWSSRVLQTSGPRCSFFKNFETAIFKKFTSYVCP